MPWISCSAVSTFLDRWLHLRVEGHVALEVGVVVVEVGSCLPGMILEISRKVPVLFPMRLLLRHGQHSVCML